MPSCFEASNREILRESMSLNSACFLSLESRCADLLIVLVISNLILIFPGLHMKMDSIRESTAAGLSVTVRKTGIILNVP